MSAITAVTSAKSIIDRLLSNGNASATSGLIKSGQRDTLAYTERFSGPEISVDYRRNGKEWEYMVATDDLDSELFFSKTGTARTLREARLEALDAVVAGCAAQAGEKESRAKEELLRLVALGSHLQAIQVAFDFDLIPQQWLRRWIDTTERRAISRGEGRDVSVEWREWADSRMAGKVTAIDKSGRWQRVFLLRTTEAAGRAAWNNTELLSCSERADAWKAAEAAELEYQRRTLLALINEM